MSKTFDNKNLQFESTANLPTVFGMFKIHIYTDLLNKKEVIVLTKGEVKNNLLVRMHSECITSESFNSLKCDCKEQLNGAMKLIEEKNSGMIIYLRQEGRGIGLANKIRAYTLQDKGFDTVNANLHLGFEDDLRNYDIAIEVLKEFNINQINLITNNPHKIKSLKDAGIKVNRIKLESKVNEYNKKYLKTKNEKSKHMINKEE